MSLGARCKKKQWRDMTSSLCYNTSRELTIIKKEIQKRMLRINRHLDTPLLSNCDQWLRQTFHVGMRRMPSNVSQRFIIVSIIGTLGL